MTGLMVKMISKARRWCIIGLEDEDAITRAVQVGTERGLPVNVIDVPAKSSFITPAQFTRGPLKVAFSSGGVAPVFVRRLRSLLEGLVSPSLGDLAGAAGRVRGRIKDLLPDSTQRRLFWDYLFDRAGSFTDLGTDAIDRAIIESARVFARTSDEDGQVQLVGAGPGDPDLLTLKAHRALGQADVILYDRLVSRDVLALARRDAELVFVGKHEGEHGLGQAGIQELMIRHAQEGRRVVRLKGGRSNGFCPHRGRTCGTAG